MAHQCSRLRPSSPHPVWAQLRGGGRAVDSVAAAGRQPLCLVSLAGLLAPTNPCAACSLMQSVQP